MAPSSAKFCVLAHPSKMFRQLFATSTALETVDNLAISLKEIDSAPRDGPKKGGDVRGGGS